MKNKIVIVAIIAALVVIAIAAILGVFIAFENTQHPLTEEQIMVFENQRQKLYYARNSQFDFLLPDETWLDTDVFFELRDYIYQELRMVSFPEYRQFRYNQIVLVHSEAEATGFPENVLVAWPSVGVEGLNMRVVNRREEINLEDFNLSYPITAADLVDHWEWIHALETMLRGREWYTFDRGWCPSVVHILETPE